MPAAVMAETFIDKAELFYFQNHLVTISKRAYSRWPTD